MHRLFYYIPAIIINLVVSASSFASTPFEWDFWEQSDQNSTATISHENWQYILNNYLVEKDELTSINYKKLKNDLVSNNLLKKYIQSLVELDPRKYNSKEQFAYWVNLYNAATVNLVIDNYPVKSIKKIGSFFESGPWNDKILTIVDHPISLNDIEHKILRPIWRDKNIHYILNCASLGCPNLQPEAVTSKNQKQLLEKAASDFINNNKGVMIIDGDSAQLSSIYKWYKVDFGTTSELIEHLNSYLKGPKLTDNFSLSYDYDWDLNSVK